MLKEILGEREDVNQAVKIVFIFHHLQMQYFKMQSNQTSTLYEFYQLSHEMFYGFGKEQEIINWLQSIK